MELINEQWLELLAEHFDASLERGDIKECRDVIEELKDNGFTLEAQSLEEELLNTPVDIFSKPTSLGVF